MDWRYFNGFALINSRIEFSNVGLTPAQSDCIFMNIATCMSLGINRYERNYLPLLE